MTDDRERGAKPGGRRHGGGKVGAILLGVLLAMAAGRARASTACGTIITNVVSLIMQDAPGGGANMYEVSYNSTATVMSICTDIVLKKYANWEEASSGTTVTFTICVANTTTNTIWGVVMTDRIPDNSLFWGWQVGTWTNGNYQTSTTVPTLLQVVSPTVAGLTTATSSALNQGQAAPYYLRWTVSYIGPRKSACVSYAAKVL